ncbi:diaminopimelate decarboxylase [Curvivirga sp.]|uniref:diaminopimelate decarboxylase n=1 Tax=Curvivirga sp. TaxID=2856848 RepID=UPI003B5B0A07
MNHFDYVEGILHAEGVSISDLAAEVGTPFYVYSSATLERHYQIFKDALDEQGLDTLVCYAVKANSNQSVLRTLGNLGAGADVVSEGEMRRALAAGIPADRIVFSGVGKTAAEMAAAMEEGILELNVESIPELDTLSKVADAMDTEAHIAIRVNPDVDANTHEKIATGKKENKFGIDIEMAGQIYAKAMELPGVKPVSIAVHIGSQLTDLAPFHAAFTKVAETVQMLDNMGVPLERIDIGGGLGIPYSHGDEEPPLPKDYAKVVKETLGHLNKKIMLEPGRLIVGNAGLLVSEVIFDKKGDTKRFVIVDAAMNDLVRPTLYDGHHEIIAVEEAKNEEIHSLSDVVGPVCETGDTFTKNRELPEFETGDLIAFGSAGAYGAVMASTYNSRLLVPEVMVKDDQFAVIRPRQDYEALIGLDKTAPWLEKDQSE